MDQYIGQLYSYVYYNSRKIVSFTSVTDTDSDLSNPYVLDILDPDPNPEPLVRVTEPDSNPSFIKQKWIRGSGSVPKCHGSATPGANMHYFQQRVNVHFFSQARMHILSAKHEFTFLSTRWECPFLSAKRKCTFPSPKPKCTFLMAKLECNVM
jgi:hypothetical protein